MTPSSHQISSGEALRLSCFASGSPVEGITWYKDGNRIRYGTRNYLCYDKKKNDEIQNISENIIEIKISSVIPIYLFRDVQYVNCGIY